MSSSSSGLSQPDEEKHEQIAMDINVPRVRLMLLDRLVQIEWIQAEMPESTDQQRLF